MISELISFDKSMHFKKLIHVCNILQVITEDIFFQDILCIEQAEEDLSGYVLEKEDYKLRVEPLTVDDFVLAIEESKLAKEDKNV